MPPISKRPVISPKKSSPSNSSPNWKENLRGLVNLDINAKRNEYYFRAPEFLTNLLLIDGTKSADAPLFYCLWNVFVFCMLNIAILPFCMNVKWYYLALITLIRFISVGLPRFILALHFTSHKPCIQPVWLNNFIVEYILASLMGIPAGTYRIHHIVMHHKEDNIHPHDLSSTMAYQRDNLLHFLFYWLRFEFGIWVELPYYTIKKKYYGLFIQSTIAILSYVAVVYYIYNYIRIAYALWIFILPQFIVSFLLMFGNWSQHIFVDPNHYSDDHQLTINLINTPYNQVTFNDGYHIMHHKYPALHWTQLPIRFSSDKEIELHGKSNSINFNDVDYFFMGLYVMTGNLKKLAKHFVPISDEQSKYTIDDIVKLFKSRLVPIPNPTCSLH